MVGAVRPRAPPSGVCARCGKPESSDPPGSAGSLPGHCAAYPWRELGIIGETGNACTLFLEGERQSSLLPQGNRRCPRHPIVPSRDYPGFTALPSNPSSFAMGFNASMQHPMCSSKSTPRSAAPTIMSSRFTLRAKALSFILFRTDLVSTWASDLPGLINATAVMNPASSSQAKGLFPWACREGRRCIRRAT